MHVVDVEQIGNACVSLRQQTRMYTRRFTTTPTYSTCMLRSTCTHIATRTCKRDCAPSLRTYPVTTIGASSPLLLAVNAERVGNGRELHFCKHERARNMVSACTCESRTNERTSKVCLAQHVRLDCITQRNDEAAFAGRRVIRYHEPLIT